MQIQISHSRVTQLAESNFTTLYTRSKFNSKSQSQKYYSTHKQTSIIMEAEKDNAVSQDQELIILLIISLSPENKRSFPFIRSIYVHEIRSAIITLNKMNK